MSFLNWARATHLVKQLDQVDARADELATEYLRLQLADGKSPYTLQAIRAALRLFFDNRGLAAAVQLPRRTRAMITRSRGPAKHDRHFQPANWQPLIKFLQATGLRRHEVRQLHVRDILTDGGQVSVFVRSGKGGKTRTVPVLPGREQDVLALADGRGPDELVFSRIAKHADIHSYRRAYAQALYLHYAPGRSLPPATGRLRKADYDRDAALRVSWALGHNRVDVVLRHYLR